MAKAILTIFFVLLLCGCVQNLSGPQIPQENEPNSKKQEQNTHNLNPFKIEEIPENPQEEMIIFEE